MSQFKKHYNQSQHLIYYFLQRRAMARLYIMVRLYVPRFRAERL